MKLRDPMRVEEVMTRDVVTCAAESSLNDAARIMWDRDCGVVPVVDAEQRVVGMITDRDACMAAYTKGLPLGAIRVGDVMARDVKSCRPEDGLAYAEELMRSRRVRRLPVVDAEGRIVGLLSLNDLARRAVHRGRVRQGPGLAEVSETLASICRPWCSLDEKPANAAGQEPAARPAPVLVP